MAGASILRIVLLIFVYMLVAILLFAVIDYRVLASAAYGFIFLIGAPFDFPHGVKFLNR
ncbi:hypothetical protein N7917_31860 [Bacillus sp. OR9]|nr:hypothetical protein [Bacillus sp. OR9]